MHKKRVFSRAFSNFLHRSDVARCNSCILRETSPNSLSKTERTDQGGAHTAENRYVMVLYCCPKLRKNSRFRPRVHVIWLYWRKIGYMRHILIVAIFRSGEYHGTTLECHSQYNIGILTLGWNYSMITLNRLYTCIGAANVPWKRFGLHCKDINITIELFCFCFVLVSKLLRNCFGILRNSLANH